MAQGQYLSTDPNAGKPTAGGGDYLSTDPNAGAAQAQAAAPTQPAGLSGIDQLLGFLKESTASINPARINQGIQSAFWSPVETAKGMFAGRQALSDKAAAAYRDGDYVTAAAKGMEWLIPFLGERMSESGDLLQEGKIGAGLGAAVDVGAQIAAPTLVKGAVGGVKQGMQNRAAKLRASSAQDITEALSPTRHRTKVKTGRIVPGMQERGLTGDLSDLKAMADDQVDTVGQQIGAVLAKNKNGRVNVSLVRRQLAADKAKTFSDVPAKKNGKPVIDATTGKPATEQAIHNPRKYRQIQAVEDLLGKYGDDLSVEQATALKKTWDDVVSQAGGFDEKSGRGAFGVGLADASEAAVKRSASNALRRELAKAVPDVQALNKEYGFWRDLQDVATASASRKTGQRKSGLIAKGVENTGRVLGGYVGYETGGVYGAGTGVLVGGEAAKRLTSLFNSPKWKLTTSARKVRLADALASRDPQQIAAAIAQVEAAQPVVQAAARETARTLPRAAERQESADQ